MPFLDHAGARWLFWIAVAITTAALAGVSVALALELTGLW